MPEYSETKPCPVCNRPAEQALPTDRVRCSRRNCPGAETWVSLRFWQALQRSYEGESAPPTTGSESEPCVVCDKPVWLDIPQPLSSMVDQGGLVCSQECLANFYKGEIARLQADEAYQRDLANRADHRRVELEQELLMLRPIVEAAKRYALEFKWATGVRMETSAFLLSTVDTLLAWMASQDCLVKEES